MPNFKLVPPGQVPQVDGVTESYSSHILDQDQSAFELYDLRVEGGTAEPLPPDFIAPKNSPSIIASDEWFTASVKIKFNKSPLTDLILCLGTTLKVDFAFEGIGGHAMERDLTATETTQKGEYEYTVKWTGTPEQAGLTDGFYSIAAVAKIGSPAVLGYGYLGRAMIQVYPRNYC